MIMCYDYMICLSIESIDVMGQEDGGEEVWR